MMEHYSPDLKFPELKQHLKFFSRSPDDAGGIYSGFFHYFPFYAPIAN